MRLFSFAGWAMCKGIYFGCEKFGIVNIFERINPVKLIRLQKEAVEC